MSGTTNAVINLGAVPLFSTLQQEYRRAREALEARTRAELQRRCEALGLRQSQADEIAGLAAQTMVEPEADASLLMLGHGAAVLRERLASIRNCPPELLARYESFQARVAAGLGPVSDLVQEYGRLSADASSAGENATTTGEVRASLGEELAAMKDEIALGFPDTRKWRRSRESLTAKVADLERLTATEPLAARQGIMLLRQRIHRELRECARVEEADRRSARRVPSMVADLVAKLTAVSSHAEFPDRVKQAAQLTRCIARGSSATSEEYLGALLRIEGEVDELFQACEADIARREAGGTVGRHVQDALLSLGYRVTVVPTDDASRRDAFVAAVTPGMGVEFSVDAGGHLKTEMVSLSDSVETAEAATQEKVCGLVDEVYRTLRRQGAQVREKHRRLLADGEQLRRVVLVEPGKERDSVDAGEIGMLRRPVQ